MNKRSKPQLRDAREPAFGRKTISVLTRAQLEQAAGGDNEPPADSLKKFEGLSMEADLVGP